MAKLHVPAPEDAEATLDPLFVAGALCFVLALAILGWFSLVQDRERQDEAEMPGRGESSRGDPASAPREIAARLRALDEEQLRVRTWADAELAAVVRFGPRAAVEAACAARSGAMVSGEPGRELARILDARLPHAPWTCLTRLFWSDLLPTGEVQRQMEGFWEELEAYGGDPRIVATILDDLRGEGERPEAERFMAWTRLCAIHPQYQAAPQCQRLLQQLAPAEGADLVLMVDRHLQRLDAPGVDLPVIIDGLGRLARDGQPSGWRVLHTRALPDYDVDLRLAAVFMLCRFAHAPDTDLAAPAARQLARTAQVGGRGHEALLLPRWRETCRLGFGGGKDRDEDAPVPLLAVWSGEEGAAPEYSLAGAIARGDCRLREGHPAWWCAASAWAGQGETLDVALADLFVHTRYMEWEQEPL